MKFEFDVNWKIADSDLEFDQRLLRLLLKINQTGSLQTAANECDISYRTAWQIIRYWNNAFHTPLCIMEKGKGSNLTQLGQKLLETSNTVQSDYTKALQASADRLNSDIRELTGKRINKKKILFYASHDLAVNLLQSLCENLPDIAIEFQSRGSLDCLKLLNSHQTDIAGFHFPEGALMRALSPIYSQWLDDNIYMYIQLANREQGLLINPAVKNRITSLNGLTRRSIKFVNRQKGSGTRAIFDELIKSENINKKEINGYEKTEFTHTAVAAMISSGHADVGFGLKAAADQFNLSFLPLIKENYVIAMNKTLTNEIKNTIRDLLKDNKLKNKINKLKGYNTEQTGKFIHARKLLSSI